MTEKSQAQEILEDPERYDEITSEYEDEVAAYEVILDQAKSSLDTFEDYAEFYSVCIENGPSKYIIGQLEENAVRSLKNMVLQTSTAGKRFPIRTASELYQRINRYTELGVESVTQRSVSFTILEHIFDSDTSESYAYMILSQLLRDQPSDQNELVAILVRSRFVIAAETVDRKTSLKTYAEELFDDLPDPKINENATSTEKIEESKKLKYRNPQKIQLVTSALINSRDTEILEKYLYLTARDIVERYRHKQRDNPWRGELQLALRQWNCILNAFSETYTDERLARSRSYKFVVLGDLKSGGRWRTQRDRRSLPEAGFLSAAEDFFAAAEEIRDIDPVRYTKYLSKSFRFQATGAHHKQWGPCGGWLATQLMHGQAVEIITGVLDELEETQRLQETILQTSALHNFRGHQAAAVVAFERRNLDKLSKEIEEARSLLETGPIPGSPDQELLETLEKLEQCLIFEDRGEFKEAFNQYKSISDPKLDVENRKYLVKIKQAVKHREYEKAKNIAQKRFGEASPILTAVYLIAGDQINSPSIKPPVFDRVSAVNRKIKWELTFLVHLLSSADIDIGSEHIEQLLYEL